MVLPSHISNHFIKVAICMECSLLFRNRISAIKKKYIFYVSIKYKIICNIYNMYNIFYSYNWCVFKGKYALSCENFPFMFPKWRFWNLLKVGVFNRNSLSTINVNSKHLKECNISVFWNISVVFVPNAEQQTQLQGPSLAVLVVPRMHELIYFFF